MCTWSCALACDRSKLASSIVWVHEVMDPSHLPLYHVCSSPQRIDIHGRRCRSSSSSETSHSSMFISPSHLPLLLPPFLSPLSLPFQYGSISIPSHFWPSFTPAFPSVSLPFTPLVLSHFLDLCDVENRSAIPITSSKTHYTQN